MPDFSQFKNEFEYRDNYESLMRDVMPLAAGEAVEATDALDFGYFYHEFCEGVFDGMGPKSGLTEVCSAILEEIGKVLPDPRAARNWLLRIKTLHLALLGKRVPNLLPLTAIYDCLDHHMRAARTVEATRAKLEEMRRGWQTDAGAITTKLSEQLRDGESLLIIGHSHSVGRALQISAAKGVMGIKVLHYCPSFKNPGQVHSCEGCHISIGRKIGAEEAAAVARSADRIVCGTCAYTTTRDIIWVTRGVGSIAGTTNPGSLKPIGGVHKIVKRNPEDKIREKPSPYVDMLESAHVAFDSAYLG